MKIKNKSLQTWAKLLPFLAPYKWQMILIIALMILGACFDMVQPLFSGYAVDNFIEPRTTEGLIPFTAVYLSMVVVQTITTILMAIYALKVEMYLGRDLKRKLFDHLQTLDFSYYNTTPVGTIMARLMSDTGKIGTVLAWSLVDIFWSSMYVLGCVVIMLFVNWKLALILIAIIPIIAVITVVFQKKILAVNRRVRAINAEVTRHYNEGISGAKTSKTLVIEEKNDKAFEKVAEDMRSTTIRAVRLNAVYIPIISFLTAIGVAMVLNQGGNMVLFGDITVGEMTVFINYALIIADPVQQLARTISNFISTQVNIERVSALLEREPLIKDTPEVIEKYGTAFDPKRENWEPIQGHITFDDVTFRYPDGVENVLEHFSLDIPAGTTVAIVGETGAGKSTAAAAAEGFGLQIIDCDKLARAAAEKGTDGLKALVAAFGKEILLTDGSLDRRALASAAFASPTKTELLNETILPHIVKLVLAEADGKNVLLDAPTLFESGLDSVCTAVIAVSADTGIRRERIIKRDGLTADAADLRINAGKTDEYYKQRADYFLYNNSDEKAFSKRFSDILKKIIGGNING